jgi:hypothetical protein
MNDDNKPPILVPPRRTIPWRVLGVLTGLCLVVAILLGYLIEGWRGARAWREYAAAQRAKGVELNWDAYLPPPVPDGENFALIPWLKPIFDFVPGTQTTKFPDALGRLMNELGAATELSKTMGYDYLNSLSRQNHRRWEKGETLDLSELLGSRDNKPRAGAKEAPISAPSEPTASPEKLAAIIRDLQSQTIDPVLDEMRLASQKKYCRFPIKYDCVPMAAILLPHFSVVKGLMQHAAIRAEARLTLNETAAAFDDLCLGFYLSDTTKGEPFLLSASVRLGWRQLLTQVIYDGITAHKWSDAQLKQLSDGLAKDDFIKDMQLACLAERAFGLRTIDQVRTGEKGFRLDDLLSDDNRIGQNPIKLVSLIFPDGWLYFEQLNLSRFWDEYLDVLARWQTGECTTDTLFKDLNRISEAQDQPADGLTCLFSHRLFLRIFKPTMARNLKTAFRTQTTGCLTRIACALERYYLIHKDYPDSLEALVPKFMDSLPADPMTKQPFYYFKEEPQHYTLYSVGSNFKDDGGLIARDKKGNWLPVDGDWGWQL